MNVKATKSRDVLWIPRRMHRSPAFRRLTSIQIFVLVEFLYRRKLAQIGPRKEWVVENNGEIIFTYLEAKEKFKVSRSTFKRAIDQLVNLGFIEIAHHGGGMLKDYSKYGICERWKEYGKKEFIEKSRQKDTRKLGFTKKNWEERTGRKRKLKSIIGITHDTRTSISYDTSKHQKPITSSIVHTTLKTDPNYYIQKGLEVLEAMHPAQYH
jgi:hypothetical protein